MAPQPLDAREIEAHVILPGFFRNAGKEFLCLFQPSYDSDPGVDLFPVCFIQMFRCAQNRFDLTFPIEQEQAVDPRLVILIRQHFTEPLKDNLLG